MGSRRAVLRLGRAVRCHYFRPLSSFDINRPRASQLLGNGRNADAGASRGPLSSAFNRHYTGDAEFDDTDENEFAGDGLVPYKAKSRRSPLFERNEDSLDNLWNRVDLSNDPVDAIKRWEAAGNKFERTTLAQFLQRMKVRRMHIKAVQILSWLIETKHFEVTAGDYEQLITLACREGDFDTAEKFYKVVPGHLSKWPAFSALVAGYASRKVVKKAESLMATGKAPLARPYAAMILMYIRMNAYDKIIKMYNDMKMGGLEPSVIIYDVLLKFKHRIGPIQGLEKDAEAALDKINLNEECSSKRPSIAGNMMHCYAMLGKADKVDQVWKRMEQERLLTQGFYIMAIESYALLGQVIRAQKIAEMKPVPIVQSRLLQALAAHFSRQGNMKRVEEMLAKADRLELLPSFGIYNHLVAGYLARKDSETAVARMRLALKVVTEERAVPSYATVMGLLPALAKLKDVATTEQMVRRYKGWKDADFYKLLLNVYVEAGQAPSSDIKKLFKGVAFSRDVVCKQLAIKAFALDGKS